MRPKSSPFPTSPRERDEQAPLGPQPTYDKVLDTAVEYTFPASDPIAVDSCCTSAERAAQAKTRPPAAATDSDSDSGAAPAQPSRR
jgi:hypothetical protein